MLLECTEVTLDINWRARQGATEALLTEFQARYPGFYSGSHLRTLRRRVQVWRREAIQRLIYEMKDLTHDLTVTA